MKNKLIDLNDHLFTQLERLNDEDLPAEKLEAEIKRSKAITDIATSVILNARLALDAQVAISEWKIKKSPAMLGSFADEDR